MIYETGPETWIVYEGRESAGRHVCASPSCPDASMEHGHSSTLPSVPFLRPASYDLDGFMRTHFLPEVEATEETRHAFVPGWLRVAARFAWPYWLIAGFNLAAALL